MSKQEAERRYHAFLNAITKDLKRSGIAQSVLMKYGKKHFGDKFLGVFGRDMIPDLGSVRPGQCCIVNNEPSHMGGEHWVALGKCQDGKWLEYDSFGRKDFLRLGEGKSRDTERDAEQKDSEENCGNRSLAWCAVFVKYGEKMAQKI